MKQIIQNYKNGEICLKDIPVPFCKPGGILIKTVNSVISLGTERAMIDFARKSIISKAKERPDLLRQFMDSAKRQGIFSTFREAMNRLDNFEPLGCSCSGIVLEVGEGVDEFQVGDRVACAGSGFASHAKVNFVPKNYCVRIPENVEFEDASFVNLGAIAMHGVRNADLTFGEKVGVIGLGLLGLIIVQILKSYGCEVMGVDIDNEKVALCLDMGADVGAYSRKEDISHVAYGFTRGCGLDAVIIAASTSSAKPIQLAAEISRDRGRIVMVGVTKMEIDRKIFYEKELDLKLSRSGGPGKYDPIYEEKGIDYPAGYIRWTVQRNMEEFLNLIAKGDVSLKKIITHRIGIEEAVETYKKILNGREKFIGIVINYTKTSRSTLDNKVHLKKNKAIPPSSKEKINVGMIGAGLFARSTLLPILKNIPLINMKGIASATGISARTLGDKFEFEYTTSEYTQILEDPDIDCVIISTRHNLHAQIVKEVLRSGKHVFVEKPLCINETELKEIIKTYNESSITNNSYLMVGFNRRFSPLAIKAKDFFKERTQPLSILYRINAGFIPKDHWVHDPIEGGGRVIGEVCHFVDFVQFITRSIPTKVFANTISGGYNKILNKDNVNINLSFADGSISSICYFASGDKSLSRERIEIFGENSVCIIDDFKRTIFVKNGKKKVLKKFKRDLGHADEFKAFFEAIKSGERIHVDFTEYIYSTISSFKIIESINKGSPIAISL